MQLPRYLVILVALAYFRGCRGDTTRPPPQDEARAEMCAEACYDVMHWDNCARENECNNLEGHARLFCMDDCLYLGVNCEFRCWDSYEAIMSTCDGRCGDSADCRKNCFLDQYLSNEKH